MVKIDVHQQQYRNTGAGSNLVSWWQQISVNVPSLFSLYLHILWLFKILFAFQHFHKTSGLKTIIKAEVFSVKMDNI